jgi:ATP-dependent Lhr-like helicase
MVALVDGELVAHLSRGARQLITFLPGEEPERSRAERQLARLLVREVREGRRRAILLETIDGEPAPGHPLASHLAAAGFVATAAGMHLRGERAAEPEPEEDHDDEDVADD